ncbi:hypothetical protein K450DRAFT_165426, partial [Umbelopsis ramanniana AG]
LKVYNGVVDQQALTSRPPFEVFVEVKQCLTNMGLVVKVEGDYKVKCVRNKRNPPPERIEPMYGDPQTDSGEEVRFMVEICRLKNLPGIYIVDISRLRGNVWAYKFLYQKL